MKYILFIFIALISCNREMNPGGIEITDAWIREAPPGATVAALYLEVKNNGPQDHILSISSPVSEIAEIHNTEISADGTARMVRLENVPVPTGEGLFFLPGGKHIMLIDLKKELTPGDNHEIILEFKNSGKKSVNAVVKGFSSNGYSSDPDHSMDH